MLTTTDLIFAEENAGIFYVIFYDIARLTDHINKFKNEALSY